MEYLWNVFQECLPGLQDFKAAKGEKEEKRWCYSLGCSQLIRSSTGKQRQLFNRSRRGEGDRGIRDRLWHTLHVTINSSHSLVFSGISYVLGPYLIILPSHILSYFI
ncbi:hypothetical protein ACN38_g1509 [Penicillium nordicum]|uniref:Uncharacterized protein n=1 Tax=Penicillium nordicum TaxID=229535 RepID=A0A0M8PH47_9EURO|nr:hypothetical protein ACN38_g1509 [Penicillium nordicum]